MERTYEVTGMKCDGCAKTVTEKLSAVHGVEKVVVDLDKNKPLSQADHLNSHFNVL